MTKQVVANWADDVCFTAVTQLGVWNSWAMASWAMALVVVVLAFFGKHQIAGWDFQVFPCLHLML